MSNTQRKTAPLSPAASHHLQEADIDLHDNLVTATDMLEFMRIVFLTDEQGLMLSASAARGVGEILTHIQSVMMEHQ